MPIKLIINPVAGGGHAKQIGQKIAEIFSAQDIPYSTDEIYRPGGGTFLTERAIEQDFGVIVAIGGDGTANEVAQGLLNKIGNPANGNNGDTTPRNNTPLLAIVPAGMGNDFAKMLRLPEKLEDLCRLIISKTARSVDVGALNDRYFLNAAGIGLDAIIAQKINQATKKTNQSYLSASFKTLLRFRPTKMAVTIESAPPFQIAPTLLSIMNGKVLGSYFHLAPKASLQDGLFDICLVGKMKRWQLLWRFPHALKGNLEKIKEAERFNTDALTVKPAQPTLAHVDGETLQANTYHITMHRGALPVIQST